jgi:hypothetical protein
MSDINNTFVVQPINQNIVVESSNINITPVATDIAITPVALNASISLTPISASFVVDNTSIAFTPTTTNLNVIVGTGSVGGNPAGPDHSLQFNDNGIFGGSPSFTVSNQTMYAENITGNGYGLYSLNAANIQGVIPYATHSDGANYANVANTANYATTAGLANLAHQVIDGYQPNIVNVGTLENLSVYTYIETGSILTDNLLHANGVAWTFGGGNAVDANFANYAGNVTISAQPNITSVGNLVALTIQNSNVVKPTIKFTPNGTAIGNTVGNISSTVITDYGNVNGNLAVGQNLAFVRARGNSAAPTTVVANDQVARIVGQVYNGSGYPTAGAITITANSIINTAANANWTPGNITFTVGNPSGNMASSATGAISSGIHRMTFDQYGRFVLTPGTAATGNTSASVLINSWGGSTGGAAAATGRMVFQRYRGNVEANVSVQPGDQLSFIGVGAYNGNAVYTPAAALVSSVDSTYTAGNTIVPVRTSIITNDSNGTSYSTTFGATGSLSVQGGYSSILNNQNVAVAAFGFNVYQNAGSPTNPATYFRARGTSSVPLPVQVNDSIKSESWWVYGDSGHQYVQAGSTYVVVTANDNAGNIASAVSFSSAGNTSNDAIQFSTGTTTFNSNVVINGITTLGSAGNVKITGGSVGQVLSTDGSGNLSWTADISLQEAVNIIASSPTPAQNIDIKTDSIWYFTSPITANTVLNFRGDGTTTLASWLAVGKSITVSTIITNAIATGYGVASIKIDGVSQSLMWLDSPPAIVTYGVASYIFTIIRTSSGFTVIGNVGNAS